MSQELAQAREHALVSQKYALVMARTSRGDEGAQDHPEAQYGDCGIRGGPSVALPLDPAAKFFSPAEKYIPMCAPKPEDEPDLPPDLEEAEPS